MDEGHTCTDLRTNTGCIRLSTEHETWYAQLHFPRSESATNRGEIEARAREIQTEASNMVQLWFNLVKTAGYV
jgi:hypothetical protein